MEGGPAIETRFHRCFVVRWGLRLCFALVACEVTLTVSAHVIARNTGTAAAMDGPEGAILCVGDSHTFGIGAPEGRSYPDQLREKLKQGGDPREVVNIGLPGLATHEMLPRLHDAVAKSKPSCVLFLGGTNDLYRGDTLLQVGAADTSLAARAHALLSRLRTFRMVKAGVRILKHDVARPEYGGAAEPLPDPTKISAEQWDAEYARAEIAGGKAVFPWVRFFFTLEKSDLAMRAFEAFARSNECALTREALRYPLDDYRWELSILAGEDPPALSAAGRTGVALDYARFTEAFTALRTGQTKEAVTLLDSLKPQFNNPWSSGFLALHHAWAALMERDFVRADAELQVILPPLEDISPSIGIYHALGGGAVAHLLRDGESRLEPWLARHPIWKERYWWPQSPYGHEWMVIAEWVDALKGCDQKAVDQAKGNSNYRFGAVPRTAPLRWLVDHPNATFADVVQQMPIDAPRISWFGPLGLFYRFINDEEADRLMRPVFEELATSARAGSFDVVLLTYLDYQTKANGVLRQFAAEFDLPIVDMQAAYDVRELEADAQHRYFSADRAHPNEAGYELMARAVYEKLRKRGIVH